MADRISWRRRAVRVTGMLGCAAIGLRASVALAQPPQLGSAESFAALAGSNLTNTGATTVTGDVGVSPGSVIVGFPPGTVTSGGTLHSGDAVAAQAQNDVAAAYQDLAARVCSGSNNLTGQDLGGKTLAPGVYCFDGPARLTGTLTLTGAGPWIFQIAGTLTTGTGSSVVVPGSTQACNGSSVFWQVGGSLGALGGGTRFVGNILARTDITLGAGALVDGRALALDGAVTTDTNTVAACSFGNVFAPQTAVKVTGGGQIAVPDPDSTDPSDGGNGKANYGFNAHPPAFAGAAATGHLNYLNHVTRLHGKGTVTDLDVLSNNTDGTAKLVRFSGMCDNVPACTFSVTVEDNGEPGREDRFGIAIVNGGLVEARSPRVISHGNIQVHESLTTSVNAASFDAGDVMRVAVSLMPGAAPTPVDAYLVLRLPNGRYLSWTGSALVPGLVPVVRNLTPVRFSGVVLQLVVPPGAPPGTYAWLSALASPGTLNLLTSITETTFTIK